MQTYAWPVATSGCALGMEEKNGVVLSEGGMLFSFRAKGFTLCDRRSKTIKFR